MSERLVATIGVFDLLHAGHLDFLGSARACGDSLVVGIASDELVERIKGRPPVILEGARQAMLDALAIVDGTHILRTMDYAAWVDAVEADVLALGQDHLAERFLGAALAVERRGGRVVRIPRSALGSTTDIVRRVFEVLG